MYDIEYIKEAQAGCSFKIKKKIWHMQYSWYSEYRDCSETGAISKYVSNIAFFK